MAVAWAGPRGFIVTVPPSLANVPSDAVLLSFPRGKVLGCWDHCPLSAGVTPSFLGSRFKEAAPGSCSHNLQGHRFFCLGTCKQIQGSAFVTAGAQDPGSMDRMIPRAVLGAGGVLGCAGHGLTLSPCCSRVCCAPEAVGKGSPGKGSIGSSPAGKGLSLGSQL